MPLLLLLAAALVAGVASGLVAWHHRGRAPELDQPEAVTGLTLTFALPLAIAAGLLFAAVTYLVRTNAHLLGIDRGAADWGSEHASSLSTHGLNVVTHLGSVYTVVLLAAVVAVDELRAGRRWWGWLFLTAVIVGEEAIVGSVKLLVERVRPTLNPAAATLGPSFPSGHSANAAAFYAAAALLLGRGRSRPTRAGLAGAAVGIAVAVAASRVLLDLHWLTDVIAGLAVGWGWFAVCELTFGRRVTASRHGPSRQ
jgi:undecaprenyl-diphosphatase